MDSPSFKGGILNITNQHMQSSGDGWESVRIVFGFLLQFHGGVEDHLGGVILGDDGDGVSIFNIV